MNANGVAKHYGSLTTEERFSLVMAAFDRGDKVETNRLANSAKQCTFSTVDYAPYLDAFREVAMLFFMELMNEYLMHNAAREVWSDIKVSDKKTFDPADKNNIEKQKMLEECAAQGFILRTKVAAWKLFCQRLGIPPFSLWQHFPGFEWLRAVMELMEKGFFIACDAEAIREWLNQMCPQGTEITVNFITAEHMADEITKVYRSLTKRHGGKSD